jgi:pimeloyl-ACP methyl ester carboxylesterase
METVTSKDGTRIAYDRTGSGPAVILVAGALGARKFKKTEQLATLLSEHCTVVNYDRRGRGNSSEAGPFAPEREIEDLGALLAAAGGSAAVWGWSSGGALALNAAAAGVPIERISVYEVPFIVDPEASRPTPDYGERLDALVAAGDRDGAVRHFMRNAMGIPAPFVALMRLSPMWKDLRSTAHTLPYDWAALRPDRMYGAPLDPAEFAPITAPVQVVSGSKSPSLLQDGSRALAEVLPNAEHHELEGVSHNLKMEKLAPVLVPFITGSSAEGDRGRARSRA